VYDEGATPFDMDDLAERKVPCWLAVDLANTRDLSVIVAVWRDGDQFYVWAWFYAPADNLLEREAKTSAPFSQWADEGFIELAGRVTDFSLIDTKLAELCRDHNVQEIAFDRALARDVMARAEDAGLPGFDFPQRPST